MGKTDPAAPVRVVEETPAYWKVIFDYPPFNILDATIFEGLQDLLVRMNTSQTLRVVVFESAIPDFYLAHFDLTGKTGNIMTAVGPSGLPILLDTFVRLTKSPVVSIAKIRGCVRGGSSEFEWRWHGWRGARLPSFNAIMSRVVATEAVSPTPAACESTMLR